MVQPLGHVHHGGVLAQQALKLHGRTALLTHLDDVAHLHQEGGDVHALAVDGEVTVGHQLTSLTAGHGEAQAIHHVVQAALDESQQILTGLAGHTGGLLVVHVELLLHDAVHELDLLLLGQLHGVLRLLSAHLTLGVAVGRLLGIAHGSGRQVQSLAPLGDGLHISSHLSKTSFIPDQTRRRFGGRQPLWGTGVTSLIRVTSRPTACSARMAASRPAPGPFT